MRLINIILAFGVFGIWLISLIQEWGIGINLLLGIMFPFVLFFDDLLYKPIGLIGYELEEKQGEKE